MMYMMYGMQVYTGAEKNTIRSPGVLYSIFQLIDYRFSAERTFDKLMCVIRVYTWAFLGFVLRA